jgi:hypothetical protein
MEKKNILSDKLILAYLTDLKNQNTNISEMEKLNIIHLFHSKDRTQLKKLLRIRNNLNRIIKKNINRRSNQ